MLDYVSRINGVPLCGEYQDLRQQSLSEVLYPASVVAAATVAGDERPKEDALRSAIPEFKRFNIIENEVRNVI